MRLLCFGRRLDEPRIFGQFPDQPDLALVGQEVDELLQFRPVAGIGIDMPPGLPKTE